MNELAESVDRDPIATSWCCTSVVPRVDGSTRRSWGSCLSVLYSSIKSDTAPCSGRGARPRPRYRSYSDSLGLTLQNDMAIPPVPIHPQRTT